VNSEQFLDGFTIEVFLELPDPFVGDHAWMGVLTWEGNNGDAGKTSGWTTEEPSCSLNAGSEWFGAGSCSTQRRRREPHPAGQRDPRPDRGRADLDPALHVTEFLTAR